MYAQVVGRDIQIGGSLAVRLLHAVLEQRQHCHSKPQQYRARVAQAPDLALQHTDSSRPDRPSMRQRLRYSCAMVAASMHAGRLERSAASVITERNRCFGFSTACYRFYFFRASLIACLASSTMGAASPFT